MERLSRALASVKFCQIYISVNRGISKAYSAFWIRVVLDQRGPARLAIHDLRKTRSVKLLSRRRPRVLAKGQSFQRLGLPSRQFEQAPRRHACRSPSTAVAPSGAGTKITL